MEDDFTERKKPEPAHPEKRRKELPWQTPKADLEDPEAQRLLNAILNSEEYRQADQDISFLQEDDTRGVRLQLDYLKVEQQLRQHGVTRSIVVFGSTRVPEPATAKRKVEELEAELLRHPEDPDTIARLRIAKRIVVKSRYYDVAREFGQIVGRSEGPSGKRLVVVTGGGPGIMEAANRGARDVQARTVGLNINLPHEQYPNPYLTPGLCFRLHYFGIRKLHFLLRARALVVFPGGYGTMDELFETLTLIQTRKIEPVPVVLVGESYWRRIFDPEFLVEEGVIDPEDRDLFWFCETAQEIWQDILNWYARAGKSISE